MIARPPMHAVPTALFVAFVAVQVLYALTFLVDVYFFTRPVDRVDMREPLAEPESQWPFVVLFYPVLRELEETMRTTFRTIASADYPPERRRVVAIPNDNDRETVASLERLAAEFPFLEIVRVPPTTDPSWQIVWDAWDANPKAYWWHTGRRAGVRALPPKKTRQLVYAFYHTAAALAHERDLLINYIDADSCIPPDHFKAAAIGIKHYDVLQAQNVAGNLTKSLPAAWHAFDHMSWDGYKYPHLSARGKQPFWVLGKGLYFRAADLVALGGFHPWITIEDPEVGMRFWKNGKRLGVIEGSLIEEVPETWAEGITQRKRWVCGFFQSLTAPLTSMGYTPWERFKAWLIFAPCLSLWINALGIPLGIWAAVTYFLHLGWMPEWTAWLSLFNLVAFAVSLSALYAHVWGRTALVLDGTAARLRYMLMVNPLSILLWWVLWVVPLAIGLRMYVLDQGLVWERTRKTNANEGVVNEKIVRDAPLAATHPAEPEAVGSRPENRT